MQKKTLLGGLLLCSAFLFTSCDKIMSQFDNAVDSHLQVADKLTVIGVGDTYTITKDVDYATISDAAPKFESQTPAIVTVDPQTGAVKALKSGDARIKISLPDNGLYLDASAIIDIKVRVQNTEQFNANVKALADGDEILFAENAAIELTEPADFSGKKVAIKGVENKSATITAKAGFIVTTKGFSLENVNIDATDLDMGLIQMGDTTGTGVHNKVLLKDAPKYSDINQNAWLLQDVISVKGCMIKNLAKPIFDAMKFSWGVDELTLENNIIQLDNNGSNFINMDGATCAIIKKLNIKGNTIYNLKANNSKYIIKGSNASNTQPQKVYGEDKDQQSGFYSWDISNNTIIKSFTAKDFANSTPSVKAMKVTMKSNIFLDVYRVNKVMQSSCQKVFEKNFIIGKDITIDNTDKTTYCTESDPGFEAPTAALDLTQKNGGLNLKPSGDAATAKAGDPRWYEAN